MQAFPSSEEVTLATGMKCHVHHKGMTLRDYFAAQALAGFCASPLGDTADDDTLADMAYGAADAMMRARAQKETT